MDKFNILYNIGQKVSYKKGIFKYKNGLCEYDKNIIKSGFIFEIGITKSKNIFYKINDILDDIPFNWDYVWQKDIQ